MYKCIITFGILLAVTTGALAADIIVESRSGGQNYSNYKEVEGTWTDSNVPAETSKSSAPGLSASADIGSRKTVITAETAGNPSTILAAARFTPPITEAGNYNVSVTWPRAGNAAPLIVLIKSATGTEKKEIAQDGWGANGNSNANQWVEVGTFPFTPAGGQYVELQVTGAAKAVDPRNAVQAFADAVRFSKDAPTQTGSASLNSGQAAKNVSSSEPAPELTWASSLTDARSLATQSGKNVLVYFSSPGSSRSVEYENSVLGQDSVKRAINKGYVAVKINIETDAALAAQLGVFRAGTIGLFDARAGSAIDRISDTPEAAELVGRLNR